MVESSQFLFVLLWLLNLVLPPVLTPKANTSVAVIFPFLSNYITVQATKTMVSEKLVRLAWAVLSPCKGHQDNLVVLCWLHNAFVTFIWSSACKKKKKKSGSGLKSGKCPFAYFLQILALSGVLGCVSNVHLVDLSLVSVILFSGHECEICLQALSTGSMTLSLSRLKEIINLKL